MSPEPHLKGRSRIPPGGRDILHTAMGSQDPYCDSSIDPEIKKWPHLATDVRDPGACLAQCHERFVAETIRAPVPDTAALCEVLNGTSTANQGEKLGWLYCCSSVLCGVSFDREARSVGEDREFP